MLQLNMQALDKFLKDSGYDSHLQMKNEDFPTDIIFLMAGVDHADNDLVMQIYLHEESPLSAEGEPLHYFFLNFICTFPYKVEKEQFGDVARLCSLVNKVSTFPGFKLSETDGAALLHYVHFHPETSLNPITFDFILSQIIYLMHLYTETFEEVSLGKRSFEESLARAHEMAKAELDIV